MADTALGYTWESAPRTRDVTLIVIFLHGDPRHARVPTTGAQGGTVMTRIWAIGAVVVAVVVVIVVVVVMMHMGSASSSGGSSGGSGGGYGY